MTINDYFGLFSFFPNKRGTYHKAAQRKVLNVEGDLGEEHLVKNIINYCKL